LKYAEARPGKLFFFFVRDVLLNLLTAFIRGLLENVGPEINPIRLIRRIKNGLEIPGLKGALIKVSFRGYSVARKSPYHNFPFWIDSSRFPSANIVVGRLPDNLKRG